MGLLKRIQKARQYLVDFENIWQNELFTFLSIFLVDNSAKIMALNLRGSHKDNVTYSKFQENRQNNRIIFYNELTYVYEKRDFFKVRTRHKYRNYTRFFLFSSKP